MVYDRQLVKKKGEGLYSQSSALMARVRVTVGVFHIKLME
jgi:hypothetical protein